MGCQGDNTAWEKAKACFDEVMPKYRLADKFSDLFVDCVQGSPESIFQLNFALAGSTTVTGVAGWSLLMALVMGRLGTAYVLQKLCMIILGYLSR